MYNWKPFATCSDVVLQLQLGMVYESKLPRLFLPLHEAGDESDEALAAKDVRQLPLIRRLGGQRRDGRHGRHLEQAARQWAVSVLGQHLDAGNAAVHVVRALHCEEVGVAGGDNLGAASGLGLGGQGQRGIVSTAAWAWKCLGAWS